MNVSPKPVPSSNASPRIRPVVDARLLLGIDDTDGLDSPGTGAIACEIANRLSVQPWATVGVVSAHQLYSHHDVPYTSFNRAMAFPLVVPVGFEDEVLRVAATCVREFVGPGANPGLCLVPLDRLDNEAALLDYAWCAKDQVLGIPIAYAVAHKLGISLLDLGGNSAGVIGALAACGLRLSGDDGRVWSPLPLPAQGGRWSVQELTERSGVYTVLSVRGERVEDEAIVEVGAEVWPILRDERAVLLLTEALVGEAPWRTCTDRELDVF